MKYTKKKHENKAMKREREPSIDMEELEALIGSEPGPDSDEDQQLQDNEEQQEQDEEEEFDYEYDADIIPVSGTEDSRLPDNIRCNLKIIDVDIVDGVEYEIVHYFYDRKHVYSIRHDRRKRTKYSHSKETPVNTKQKIPMRLIPNVMRVIKKKCIDPITIKKVQSHTPFPIQDDTSTEIEEAYTCNVPERAYYFADASDTMKFPHVSVEELRKNTPQFVAVNASYHPLAMKDIVWRAEGREIPKDKDVYPSCGMVDCFKLDHLRLCDKQEYIDLCNSSGNVHYVEYVDGATTQDIYTCCQNRSYRKKLQVYVGDGEQITSIRDTRHPFNFEEPTPPISYDYDRESSIPVMRLTIEEAERLYKHYVRPQIENIQRLKNVVGNKEQTLKYQQYERCVHLRTNKNIFVQKGHAVLQIPEHMDIYKYVKRVYVKDIVWRAHGHAILEGHIVFSVCGDKECTEPNHLVLETRYDHLTRTKSCGFILGLKGDDLIFVVDNCKHDNKKCRVPIILKPTLYKHKN